MQINLIFFMHETTQMNNFSVMLEFKFGIKWLLALEGVLFVWRYFPPRVCVFFFLFLFL